jgi:hypothetical protein
MIQTRDEYGNLLTAIELTVVAVSGPHDWVAYWRILDPHARAVDKAQHVAKHGHKLSADAARQLFPNIEGQYRD